MMPLLTSAAAAGSPPLQDPAALLGLPPQPAPQPRPTWVHGDLTAENILFPEGAPDGSKGSGTSGGDGASASGGSAGSAPGQREAVLIDFADGGQGDPLWDLPALFIRSFRWVGD